MATSLYLHISHTGPAATLGHRYNGPDIAVGTLDMLRAASAGSPSEVYFDATGDPVQYLVSSVVTGPVAWQSERLAAQATISGDITVTTYAQVASSGITARVRASIWKRTAGGSAVDTLIGTGEGAAAVTTTLAAHTITIIPPAGVVVSPQERLIVQLYADTDDGLALPAIRFSVWVNGTVANQGETKIVLTETVTFLDNAQTLYLLNSKLTGIGIFRDLLPTFDGSSQQGIVAVRGVADIPWTLSPVGCTAIDRPQGVINDTTNTDVYTSGSWTPVSSRLYLLAVVHSDAAAEATEPTVTGSTGRTWTKIGSVPFDTIASNLHRLTVFRSLDSRTASETYTVTFADNSTGCLASLTEVSGIVTTGTNGANAVRNIVTNNGDATANPAITLGAFSSGDNGTWSCFGSDIATAPTAGAGFTTLVASTYSTPTTGLYTEWTHVNDTSVNCTLASSDWAGLALELVVNPAGQVMEWITPRFAQGLLLTAVDGAYEAVLYVWQSNVLANATVRLRLFRWRDGVETEFLDSLHPDELTTTSGNTLTFTTAQQPMTEMAFAPDDRLVLRPYLDEAVGQTMGAPYTATLWIHVSAQSFLRLREPPLFKAEADPPTPATVPDGLMLGGVGN